MAPVEPCAWRLLLASDTYGIGRHRPSPVRGEFKSPLRHAQWELPSQRSTRRLADAAGHDSATTVQLYGRPRRGLDGYSVLDMTSQDASVVMVAPAPCDLAGPSRWSSTLSMIKR